MSQHVELLLQQFLDKSLELRNLIAQYDVESDEDVEQWVNLLNQRQHLIDQVDDMIQQGFVLAPEQKQTYLQPALAIDEEVKPILKRHMTLIQSKLADMRKKKVASMQYTGYGAPEAYGTFFDKKK